ncbi:MAG: Na+/H+ antiporter NhaA [bacterium]|nr:Na+/H+ antiporter NhaA [bacterium]
MTKKNRTPVETLQQFSLPLIAGVFVAVVWANLGYNSYHSFIHWAPIGYGFNFHFLINDIFMVFFFGIAAKEITESFLPGGALSPMSKAVNPLLATLGGVVGPICVYFAYVHFSGDASIKNGWGIPTATDIAIAWLVARIIFGAKHPAVSFLLLLAIADDAIGLVIIAIFYPDPAHPVQPLLLLIVLGAVLLAWGLRKITIADNDSRYLPFLMCGFISWIGLYYAGLHPALALVPIVPFMPGPKLDEGLFAEHGHKHTDTLNRFGDAFRLPVDIGLFAFGLANAGVVFSTIGNATWAVLLALVIGKTVGITLFSLIAEKVFHSSLPTGMNKRDLIVAGMIASIGLTVALFVAGVAFTDASMTGAAKMGALFSAGMAPVAILAGLLIRKRKEKKDESTVLQVPNYLGGNYTIN